MRSENEIRALRGGRGFLTLTSLADALNNEGIPTTARSLALKEKGRIKYSAREVEGLAKVLGISYEEAFSFFA